MSMLEKVKELIADADFVMRSGTKPFYKRIGLKVKKIAGTRSIAVFEVEDVESGEKAYLVEFPTGYMYYNFSIGYGLPEPLRGASDLDALLYGYLGREGPRMLVRTYEPETKRVKIYEVENPKLYRIRVRKYKRKNTYLMPFKISPDKVLWYLWYPDVIEIPIGFFKITIDLVKDPITYVEKGTASENVRKLYEILEKIFKVEDLSEANMNVSTA